MKEVMWVISYSVGKVMACHMDDSDSFLAEVYVSISGIKKVICSKLLKCSSEHPTVETALAKGILCL